MTIMDAISVLSLAVGITSIAIAIFAMNSAKRSEARSLENFNNTHNKMRDFYDQTKDLLNSVDKRAGTTETIVKTTQEDLLSTITNIINETVIPKKEDMGDKLGMMFLEQIMNDPNSVPDTMNALMPLIELGKKMENDES